MNNDYKFMTYKEAATALSTSIESVRVQAMRNHWPKRKNNKKQVIVGVPLERLEDINADITDHNNVITTPSPVHELQKKVAVLETELKNAVERIEDLKTDRDAWRQQAQAKRSWFWRRAG